MAPKLIGLSLWKWLVLLLVLLVLGYCMLNRRPTTESADVSPTQRTPTDTAAIPASSATNPRLSLQIADGKLRYSGRVASDEVRTSIIDAIHSFFAAGNVEGELKVDAKLGAPRWLDALPGLIAALKVYGEGVSLDFDGDRIALGGSPAEADKGALSTVLRASFGDYQLEGLSGAGAQPNPE